MLVRLCALIFEFDMSAKQVWETSVGMWETATVGPTTLSFRIGEFTTETLAFCCKPRIAQSTPLLQYKIMSRHSTESNNNHGFRQRHHGQRPCDGRQTLV
jgi:hypothetical protein